MTFKLYRKAEKLSLNLDMLSYISWRCIRFVYRSVSESASSANVDSSVSRGNECVSVLGCDTDVRRESRDDRRRGVVGREGGHAGPLPLPLPLLLLLVAIDW